MRQCSSKNIEVSVLLSDLIDQPIRELARIGLPLLCLRLQKASAKTVRTQVALYLAAAGYIHLKKVMHDKSNFCCSVMC